MERTHIPLWFNSKRDFPVVVKYFHNHWVFLLSPNVYRLKQQFSWSDWVQKNVIMCNQFCLSIILKYYKLLLELFKELSLHDNLLQPK